MYVVLTSNLEDLLVSFNRMYSTCYIVFAIVQSRSI
jgi:hypothetical protein